MATAVLLQSAAALPLDSSGEQVDDDTFNGFEGTLNNEDDQDRNSILPFPPVLATKWGVAVVEGAYIKHILDEEENDVGINFDDLTVFQQEFGRRTRKGQSGLFGRPTARNFPPVTQQVDQPTVTKTKVYVTHLQHHSFRSSFQKQKSIKNLINQHYNQYGMNQINNKH